MVDQEKPESGASSEPATDALVVATPSAVASAEPLDPLAWLSPAERYAYDYFLGNFQKAGATSYPLATDIADGMFNLYMQGKTLGEIRALNRHFGYGQVIHAAVTGDWYVRRARVLEDQVPRARARAVQAAAEGLELTADMVAALRRLHSDNIARFLQTGNPIHLGPALSMTSIRQLKELADLLLKFTGQEQTKKVSGTIKHEHVGAVNLPTTPVGAPPPKEASRTLASWAEQERAKLRAEREE